METLQDFSSSPNKLLTRELAETLVLLDYLTSRPDSGRGWPYAPPNRSSVDSQAEKPSPAQKIEEDLASQTTLVRRIYAIRASLTGAVSEADGPSDAAFLLRAKAILSELAAPATSLTIGFTSIVFNAPSGLGSDVVTPVAEVAFPNLKIEAQRLARSVRWSLPITIGFITLAMAAIVGLADTPLDNPSGWLGTIHWFAKAAYASGIVPAFLGLLGALASILRRFQQLAAAQLLYPGLRSKNLIDAWLGLVAGSGVGFLSTGMPLPGAQLALYAAAFVAGYSTEIAFSLLDLLIAQLSRIQLFQERTPQLRAVLKSQSAIADTVSQIHNQIEQFQGKVTLDPFEGAVIVRVTEVGGWDIRLKEYSVPAELSGDTVTVHGAKLAPEGAYELHVKLDRDATSQADVALERFATGSGSKAVTVAFDVALNCRDIRFTPKAETVTIDAGAREASFASRFQAPSAPGRYDIFAEVYQKNRLVQVALLPVVIESAAQ
jgi:hypothetical protein